MNVRGLPSFSMHLCIYCIYIYVVNVYEHPILAHCILAATYIFDLTYDS